jgi:hypothetical protein
MTNRTREQILEEIRHAESYGSTCGCKAWDCYGCYQDGMIENEVDKLKLELRNYDEARNGDSKSQT